MNRVVAYLREVKGELKKVVWPTRRETAVFTAVVLLSVGLITVLIWAMDGVLGFLLKLLLRG